MRAPTVAETEARIRRARVDGIIEEPFSALPSPKPAPDMVQALPDDGRVPPEDEGTRSSTARDHPVQETKEETTPVPMVNRGMFTGILGDIVMAADPSTEADPVGVYVSLLAGVGVFIGPGPHVQVGNTRHPLLVWPLLLGRTGSGRKGEAEETASVFLLVAMADYHLLSVSGLSSGEGLIERIRDPNPDNDKETGGTMDKRLLVVEPEFAAVMTRAKREGNTLATILRQAWDGRGLTVLNRRALEASASHIGIVGHITPKEFRLRLAESDMAGGSYNRLLPIYVERSKRLPIPEGVDADLVAELAAQLRAKMEAACKIDRIRLGQDAADLWCQELYDEFTAADDEDAAWTEFTRRAAPYCLRIAGLFTVLAGRRLITADDLQASGHLVRYAVASAKYILDRQHRDPQLDRIRRAIDSTPEGLTRTQVSALFSRNITKEILEELLERLLGDSSYERAEVRTGGRPAVRYRRR